MFRKILITVAALLAAIVIAAYSLGPACFENQLNQVKAHKAYHISDKARVLHSSLVIGDLHADTLLWNRDLLVRGKRGHVDVPRLVEGNVAVGVEVEVANGRRDARGPCHPDIALLARQSEHQGFRPGAINQCAFLFLDGQLAFLCLIYG